MLFDRRRRPGIPSDGGGYSPEEFEAVLVFDMVGGGARRRRRRRPKDAQQILRRDFFALVHRRPVMFFFFFVLLQKFFFAFAFCHLFVWVDDHRHIFFILFLSDV